jgi:hypothetical protein
MNFRRAILRLWLVISGLWIGGVLLGGILLVGSPNRSLYEDNTALVWAIALVPPLVVRTILALLGWGDIWSICPAVVLRNNYRYLASFRLAN